AQRRGARQRNRAQAAVAEGADERERGPAAVGEVDAHGIGRPAGRAGPAARAEAVDGVVGEVGERRGAAAVPGPDRQGEAGGRGGGGAGGGGATAPPPPVRGLRGALSGWRARGRTTYSRRGALTHARPPTSKATPAAPLTLTRRRSFGPPVATIATRPLASTT